MYAVKKSCQKTKLQVCDIVSTQLRKSWGGDTAATQLRTGWGNQDMSRLMVLSGDKWRNIGREGRVSSCRALWVIFFLYFLPSSVGLNTSFKYGGNTGSNWVLKNFCREVENNKNSQGTRGGFTKGKLRQIVWMGHIAKGNLKLRPWGKETQECWFLRWPVTSQSSAWAPVYICD